MRSSVLVAQDFEQVCCLSGLEHCYYLDVVLESVEKLSLGDIFGVCKKLNFFLVLPFTES